MKTKGLLFPVAFSVVTVLFVFFERYRFDLAIRMNSFAVGSLTWVIYILYGIMGISTILRAILQFKTHKWQVFIPIIIFFLSILYVFIYPLTDMFLNRDIAINSEKRQETVEMLEKGQLEYYRMGMDEYTVPYRRLSYTGTMLVQERGDVLKVLFYAYKGVVSTKIIVYTSDDSGLVGNDFNFDLSNYNRSFGDIQKISPNWYFATMGN